MEQEKTPFWEQKTLEEMSGEEWEQLCDGCGRCCLVKLEDEDTGAWHLTKLACRLLDIGKCRCRDYADRHNLMPDCVAISPSKVRQLDWLPDTCAYRLIAEGRRLHWWHPLISGQAESVHEAGISVRGKVLDEAKIDEDAMERYIIQDYPRHKQGGMKPA